MKLTATKWRFPNDKVQFHGRKLTQPNVRLRDLCLNHATLLEAETIIPGSTVNLNEYLCHNLYKIIYDIINEIIFCSGWKYL